MVLNTCHIIYFVNIQFFNSEFHINSIFLFAASRESGFKYGTFYILKKNQFFNSEFNI